MKAELLTILIVEDNPADHFLIEDMLLSSGLSIKKIFIAVRQQDAISILNENTIDLVLLDLSLPDSFGMDSFIKLKILIQKIPVIILTGLADSEIAFEALKQGAQDYLVKGEITSQSLIKSIQYSIERKKVEEKVLASEEKYRQIFYKNPFPMWISDCESLAILEVNEAAVKTYGYERPEFIGLTMNHINHSTDVALVSTNTQQKTICRHYKKNGEQMTVEFSCYPINYFGRTALQVQINDVTEKMLLEKELSQKNEELIEAVLDAQENERKVIGEELHDNINQILSAVLLTLSFVLENEEAGKDLLQKCIKNTNTAISEVRKLSHTLVLPGNLRDLGLVSSIEILIKDIQSVTELSIEIHAARFIENDLAHEQRTALYRIAQEQLNNILKYAQASRVIITLETIKESIHLSIRDNGKGFDPKVKSKGLGLYNITNRAKLFEGNVIINSSPGNGCELKVMINTKKRALQDWCIQKN